MCRNIKPLFNFDPPATDREIREASRQFVKKVSGFNKPSRVNEEVFESAVGSVAMAVKRLLDLLETNAVPKDRDVALAQAREKAAKRFGLGKQAV